MLDALAWHQWALGGAAAILVGAAKTGVPGLGILVVPIMATAFGGKASVGTLLPLLIVADIFAVSRYRHHADWSRLWRLFPWVLPGVVLGAVALWGVERVTIAGVDGSVLFRPLIGLIVLTMLGLVLARRRWGDALTPHSPTALASAGVGAGFATTVANSAGPVMTLYLAGLGYSKQAFMGTNAWFFLILNLVKVPIYLALTVFDTGGEPLFTTTSLMIDAVLVPVVLVGVAVGLWIFPRIPQQVFDRLVLGLAALSAVRLLLSPWI